MFGIPLKVRYPDLFSASQQWGDKVGNMGYSEDRSWVWIFRWSRELLEENLNQVNELSLLLDGLVRPNSKDIWCCSLDPTRGYSVKAAYSYLSKNLAGTMVPSAILVSALAQVWKSRAPPKVAAPSR